MTSDNRNSRTPIVASLLLFGVTAMIAVFLLLTALVVWLAYLMGSFVASLLVTGGFFTLLALAIYFLSVRTAMNHIRDQSDTVYQVAHAAKMGYEWVADRFGWLLNLIRGK